MTTESRAYFIRYAIALPTLAVALTGLVMLAAFVAGVPA